MRTAANISLLGDLNARLLLSAVRRRQTASRPELAGELQLSLQAVTRIVAQLEQAGLLTSCGKQQLGLGQPTRFYQLEPSAAYSMGLQLHRRLLRLVLTDFCGQVLTQREATLTDWQPAAVCAALAPLLADVLSGLSPAQRDKLCGLGVAMPWFAGNPLFAGALWPELDEQALQQRQQDWQQFDLRGWLAAQLPCPVLLENDGAAATTAELLLAQPATDFLYLYLDDLPAAGLVLQGQLWRGRHGNAAHLAVLPAGAGLLFQQLPPPAKAIAADEADWLARAVPALRDALQATMATLDLPVVVIDSSQPQRLPSLLPALAAQLSDWPALGLLPPKLQQGRLGSDAMLLGAAMLPLYQAYAPDRTVL